mgnify:CR=1 FL=1
MTFLSPQKEKSLDPLKIKAFLLAEKEGFEPSRKMEICPYVSRENHFLCA